MWDSVSACSPLPRFVVHHRTIMHHQHHILITAVVVAAADTRSPSSDIIRRGKLHHCTALRDTSGMGWEHHLRDDFVCFVSFFPLTLTLPEESHQNIRRVDDLFPRYTCHSSP